MRVLNRGFLQRGDHSRKVLVAIEDHEGGLCVAPIQISQQLVNRFGQTFWAPPIFAFGDENILVLLPDKNVGFAAFVERLSGRTSLVMPIQDHEEKVSEVLFLKPFERA